MKRYNGKCPFCKTKASVLAERIGSIKVGNFWTHLYKTYAEQELPGTLVNPHHIAFECPNGCKNNSPLADNLKFPLKPVTGKTNNKIQCNKKCENAIGHSCECSCGGKNHGDTYSI